MKKLSKKWLILEHYIRTAEIEMNGVIVRVWKPRFMGKLPAIGMRDIMVQAYKAYDIYAHNKVLWGTRHPDYGFWDAQIAICADPHRKCVDVYICALLIRPFSEEAHLHYAERSGLEPMDRLVLMWDSRQFDADGGYSTEGNGSFEAAKSSFSYEDIFQVRDKMSDIEDSSK